MFLRKSLLPPPTFNYESLIAGLNAIYELIKLERDMNREIWNALKKSNEELGKIRGLLADSYIVEKEQGETNREMLRATKETLEKTKAIFTDIHYNYQK